MDQNEAIRLLSMGATQGSPAWNAYYGPGGYYGQQKSVQDATNDTFLQQPQVFNPILNPGYNAGVASAGYNPGQYANDKTTETLAALLGGTPYLQTYNDSPFNIPPMNMLNINGQLYNAGLLAKAFQNGDPNFVAKMYGLTLNQPVLNSLQQQANYNAGVQNGTVPQAAAPVNSAASVNAPFKSASQYTPATPTRQGSPGTQTNSELVRSNMVTPQVTEHNVTPPNYSRTSTTGTRSDYSAPGTAAAFPSYSARTDPSIQAPASPTISRVARLENMQQPPAGGGGGASQSNAQTLMGRPNYSGYTRSGYNW